MKTKSCGNVAVPPSKARVKTVFKSNEIAHVWTTEKVSRGRSPGNMSFAGAAFYSYQTVIARIIRARDKRAFVVDQSTFSSSTSNHQGSVRRAIGPNETVFPVWCGRRGQGLEFTPITLRDYYVAQFRVLRPERLSRYAHTRARALLHRATMLDRALDVCAYFELASAKIQTLKNGVADEVYRAQKIMDDFNRKQKTRREVEDERRSKERKAREVETIREAIDRAERLIKGERFPDLGEREDFFGHNYGPGEKADQWLDSRPELKLEIAEWRNRTQAEDRQTWINGGNIQPGDNWPVLLRCEGGEMVTSKGARVPLDEARRAYDFAVAVRKRGWRKNGERQPIGIYELDAINDDGIVAGCHRVTWDEVSRFALVMGWWVEGV